MTTSPSNPPGEAVDQHPQSPFLLVKDVAAIFGVSRQTIYDAIERDEIPSIRLGKTIRIPVARLREKFQF
jgi:excisionase family DNA binding protein